MPRLGWKGKSAVPKAMFVAGIFLALAAIIGLSAPSRAQSLPGLTPGSLNQLQQQLGGQNALSGAPGGITNGQTVLPSSITLQPVSPNAQPPLPPSRLEEIMSARAGAQLRQFGYDQLGRGAPVTIPETGAVQDDYVLGPGDEIVVSLRGQENGEFRTTVDRNGQVVLPRLSPIPATGRTFGDFRQDLEAAVHRAYVATNASVSVGRVRQISVMVSGEVNSPGVRLVTGLSSVVDALLLSGGVKKTGSLRSVQVQRGTHRTTVDLYAVLTSQGESSPLRLADGDRILVPLLGKTAAVTGLVRQPAIYELAPGQSTISVRSLMALAGGEEVRGQYRLSVLRIDQDGRNAMVPLAGESGTLHGSEILFVEPGADQTISQATLAGGIGLAGLYAIQSGTKLSDLIKAPGALGRSPYTLFGIISRQNPQTLLRALVAFTPTAVLRGSEDQSLQAEDIVHPFTEKEVRLVTSTIRLYQQARAQADQTLRDPLSDINPTPVQVATPPAAGGTPATSGTANVNSALLLNSERSTSQVAQDEESSIRLIGSLTQRQLDMVASNQVSLTDFRYLPERTRDLDSRDGVYLPPPAQNFMQSPQSTFPSSVVPSRQNFYGEGIPVAPQAMTSLDQNGQPIQRNPNQVNSPPPAPNFQEQPSQPGVFPTNREAPTFNTLAQQLGVDPLVLVNFVMDHQVTLDGAVRGPGTYFVGPNASLKDLIAAAGGTVNWADDSGVELVSTAVDTRTGRSITENTKLPLGQGLFASYVVKPHDQFRFNKVFTNTDVGNVTIQGEVRYSGTYPITRGDHLSALLARAGGLTDVAYPYGTVFLRKSAADKEHEGYLRAANEIEDQLVVAMTRIGNDKIDVGTFGALQTFVTDLRNQKAVGRISVTADPSILAARPELDPLLEAGDVVYIPQRPSTVAVLGQVAQPGNFPYRPGLGLADYVQQAGGYSATADESMTFVVLPDGSARKVQTSWLSFASNDSLPPGSTIVVPRDITPLDTRQIILDASSIFSQLAVSMASLAVLSTVK